MKNHPFSVLLRKTICPTTTHFFTKTTKPFSLLRHPLWRSFKTLGYRAGRPRKERVITALFNLAQSAEKLEFSMPRGTLQGRDYIRKRNKKALCNLIQNALFLYPKFLLRQPYSREKDFVLFVQNAVVSGQNLSHNNPFCTKSTKPFSLQRQPAGGVF